MFIVIEKPDHPFYYQRHPHFFRSSNILSSNLLKKFHSAAPQAA